MGKINLTRPDGSIVTVDEESKDALKKLGYKETTDKEVSTDLAAKADKSYYTSPIEKLKTAGEGALSGLSLGTLDPLITSDESRARARYNPGTRIGSEIVGAVVPDILSGGTTAGESAAEIGGKIAAREVLGLTPAGLAARAGRAVEESKAIAGLGKATRVGAGAAVEGALGGAGAAITNAQLNNDPLTVESVLAGAGMGSLVGFGAGAIGSKLESGVTKAFSKEEPAIVGSLSRTEEDAMDKFYSSLPKEKTVKNIPEWEKAIPNEPLPIERSLQKADISEFQQLESFGSVKAGLGEHLDGINEAVKDVDAKLAQASQMYGKVDNAAKELMGKVAKNKAIVDIDSEYSDLRRALKAKNVEDVEDALDNYLAKIEDQLGGTTGKELDPAIRASIANPLEEYKKLADNVRELVSLKEAAGVLKDFPDKIDDFRRLKASKAEKLFAALDVLDKNPETASMHTYFDKTLEDMGLSVSGSTGTKARAIWESNKMPGFFRNQEKEIERASFNLNKLGQQDSVVSKNELRGREAKDYPKIPEIKNQANELILKMNPEKTGTPELRLTEDEVNQILFKKEEAIANQQLYEARKKKGTSRFLKRVADSAGARFSAKAARQVGGGVIGSALAFEAGGSLTDMLFSGLIGSTIAGNRESVTSRIAQAARKVTSATLQKGAARIGTLAVRIDGTLDNSKKSNTEMAMDRIEEVNQLAINPRDHAFQAVEDISMEHPDFAKAVIDTFENSVRALKSFIPKDPGLAFSHGKSLHRPDAIQQIQLGKALEVFHDPIGVMEKVSTNLSSADVLTINMLQTIHPTLYSEFQGRVLEEVQPKLPTATYDELSYYSIITGVPFHSSFTPRSMAQTAAIYQAEIQQQAEKKQQGSTPTNRGGRPAHTEQPTPSQGLFMHSLGGTI